MTSAISANNLFSTLATAKTITVDQVEKVVAEVPKGYGLTEDGVYRDLGQIAATKAFGEQTPALADDVKAKIDQLQPLAKADPLNNVAVQFASILSMPPSTPFAQLSLQTHFVTAAITGAVVALEGQLAANTDEQKEDKENLVSAFKNHVGDISTMQTFAGLWSSLAEPTKEGKFTLTHDEAKELAASLANDGEQTPGLQSILQARLAPASEETEGAAATAKAEPKEAEFDITRPIGGKSTAELEAIYKEASTKANIARITYDPETFRTEKYQKILNMLDESPLTQILKPILTEEIARYNVQTRRAQKANYTEISPENAAKVTDKQLVAIRKTAMAVAEKMGAGDPSVTRIAATVLNAWVSSIDLDHPHVTYYSYLQDIVWDRVKGDWIKFYVDKDGKECSKETEGAKEISGENLVAMVFAHEMTHISEGAVLNQFLLSVMLGVNLSAGSPQAGHDPVCVCNTCAGLAERSKAADALLASPAVQAITNDPAMQAERTKLAAAIGIDNATLNKAIEAKKLLNQDAQKPVLNAEQRAQASAAAYGLEAFFLMFTRQGESTADYGAVRVMGPESPKWMAMAFDIVTRGAGKGSPEERLVDFKESYFRDHFAEAQETLKYSEEGGKVSHAQFASQTTHPTHLLRALANFRFADRKDTKSVYAFESRDVRVRLLGAAQAVDSRIEELEDEHAYFQKGSASHAIPEENDLTLEAEHNEQAIAAEYERMQIVTSQIAKLIFDDGLPKSETDARYFMVVRGFMAAGGEPIFRHEGSINPLQALLGSVKGGNMQAPACIKMAGQIGQELQKIVDGATLSDEERQLWWLVIGSFKKVAEEGGAAAQGAREARSMSRAAVSQLRNSL